MCVCVMWSDCGRVVFVHKRGLVWKHWKHSWDGFMVHPAKRCSGTHSDHTERMKCFYTCVSVSASPVHVHPLLGQHYVSKLDTKGKRQKKRQKKKVEDYIMERLLLSSSESIQINTISTVTLPGNMCYCSVLRSTIRHPRRTASLGVNV